MESVRTTSTPSVTTTVGSGASLAGRDVTRDGLTTALEGLYDVVPADIKAKVKETKITRTALILVGRVFGDGVAGYRMLPLLSTCGSGVAARLPRAVGSR